MRFQFTRGIGASFIGILPLLAGFVSPASASQEPFAVESPHVEIRQIHDVEQGESGWFNVEIKPESSVSSITLRLNHFAGTGAAVFENGTEEYGLTKSASVEIRGLVASDAAGGMILSAWSEGARQPLATTFFDVLATTPHPHIFWSGRDVTDTSQTVVVGQQISLNVILHPALEIREQGWTIQPTGEYVGGFVHLPGRGGPQPVTLTGPALTIYWVRPGAEHKVTYRVTLNNGETATADVSFSVEGPSLWNMEVSLVELKVGPGNTPSSSYMSFAGTGISFLAHYDLPDGLMRNYTWAQIISRDEIEVKLGKETMACEPKSLPQAELGVGLDSEYPYDWRNPTKDIPPLQLQPDAEEIWRRFSAKMYLLWGSGLSNSIPVPLGYVAWHFEGHAKRKDLLSNTWTLINGSGGADDPQEPYRRTKSYPSWSMLIPYSGELECN